MTKGSNIVIKTESKIVMTILGSEAFILIEYTKDRNHWQVSISVAYISAS